MLAVKGTTANKVLGLAGEENHAGKPTMFICGNNEQAK